MMPSLLPRYDFLQSYDWNYLHAPDPVDWEFPAMEGSWRFCGLPVDSPLGIPAGPLLNGRWLLYYAKLGFDVLTYKTVRSRARECYPMPNLVPVKSAPLRGEEPTIRAIGTMEQSWAISFGMPSKEPDVWRADVEFTRKHLDSKKILCLSVVGSVVEGGTIDDLATDYARCARWGIDSGADAIEINLSCPNVETCDGQLYQDHVNARIVTQAVREEVTGRPLLLKIGAVSSEEDAIGLVESVGDFCDGLSMTNCLSRRVIDVDGHLLFQGNRRGIGGEAIRESSLNQVERFRRAVAQTRKSVEIIGVGGVFHLEHVMQYLHAGASAVQVGTAAMLQPEIAIRIREELSRRGTCFS